MWYIYNIKRKYKGGMKQPESGTSEGRMQEMIL